MVSFAPARSPLALAAILAALVAGVTSAQERPTVDDLAWLAGCWASVDGESGSGEQWTVPAGKILLGTSRTVENGRTVAYEFLQIRETAAGEIEYVARPSGQAGATFAATTLTGREAVFENPDHDFPQRIIYRLQGEGRLAASIEGVENGEISTVDFPMRRVDCATPPAEP